MTTFRLIGAAAVDPSYAEARDVVQRRGRLVSGDAADVIIGDVPTGMRHVPPEIVQATRALRASGVLLWTREPMIRPIVSVQDNVVIVSTTRREHVLAGLDMLLGERPQLATTSQSLHRSWWSGWVVGAGDTQLQVAQSDADGITLLHASKPVTGATAALRAPTDPRRQARLQEIYGDDLEMVHLSGDANHWLVHWSRPVPLWLFSSLRMPSRWSVAATLQATGSRFVRMSAFPGDLMVAASIDEQDVAKVLERLALGALDVFRVLGEVARGDGQWAFVIEAR